MASLSPALAEMIKSAKNKYSRNNARTVKLKEGKTRVRILQAKPTDKFWEDLGVHWIKTEKNGKPVAVVGCREAVHEEPCEICNAIERAMKTAVDDESIAIIKEWKTKKSVLLNALIRSGSDASDEPQILEVTPTTFAQMCSIMEEYGDMLDAKTGTDFIIERVGKGLDTEYRVMPAPKSDPVPKGAIDKMHDLKEFVEREFFRGEERKALNAIAQMTGVTVSSALSGPRGTALLTSPAASLEEAAPWTEETKAVDKTAAKTTAAKKAPAKVEVDLADLPNSEIEDMLADLDDLT